MISRLILRNQSIFQLCIAAFGSLFGLVLLLGSLQLYFDFQELLTTKTDLISPQFLVVNKTVSVLNTLSLSKTSFSKEDIEEIKKVRSVTKVGVFTSNLFPAQALIKEGAHKNVPGLYTDLFFESVPDEFIDVKTSSWNWAPGDSIVPLIVPADYLNLYNFGFAPSRGMPQISKGTIKMVSFTLRIQTKDGNKNFIGNIAGFSERINSFLVPQSFLDDANKNFGTADSKEPSRIIIMSDDPSSPELSEFLEKKGYETGSENLKNGKLNSILRIIMNIMVAIGGVIIIMSVLSFIQYSQLLINRSKYEIQTLIQIGYHYSKICARYLLFYGMVFITVLLIAFTLLGYFKNMFNLFMSDKGFEMSQEIFGSVYVAGLGLFFVFFLFNAISVFASVRRLAKAR